MNKNLISLPFLVLFIVGCQQNIAPSSDSAPIAESAQASLIDEPESEVTNDQFESEVLVQEQVETIAVEKELTASEKLTLSLIERGEQALSAQRLLTPEEDNANLYFQAALGRDPGNFRATQGIANIVETYTDWAWASAVGRGYKQADRYLGLARSVNPEDPLIEDMAAQIRDLKTRRAQEAQYRAQQAAKKAAAANSNDETAEQNEEEPVKKGVYHLPETLFSLSDEEIIGKIQPIIDEVAKTEQSIAIYWPNDKEARLIYQIINSRIPEFRVRAMTFRQADHTVELQQD
ncbi:hypothetical protein [Marinomonas sp. GJ51-6]|uniref:hypothetical protein n=1 Tax=Marinomonas sp. GJ51-6 TaxID=2992802 RepID=UPI002934306D|nr:hypothetical protein [Marinomonas sp. GJ51-6]WOD07931.1 hypothetical protein ONZ50_01785 [Marinomonas sp. GJ51-6]